MTFQDGISDPLRQLCLDFSLCSDVTEQRRLIKTTHNARPIRRSHLLRRTRGCLSWQNERSARSPDRAQARPDYVSTAGPSSFAIRRSSLQCYPLVRQWISRGLSFYRNCFTRLLPPYLQQLRSYHRQMSAGTVLRVPTFVAWLPSSTRARPLRPRAAITITSHTRSLPASEIPLAG